MAKFNLNEYETVDERIQRFYRKFPEGRIETELTDFAGDHGKTRWITKALVFRNAGEPPAGTGYAFEVDGTGMANKTSALENCETSAIGRALAAAGFSGSRKTTREEMLKVKGAEVREDIAAAKTEQDLNRIYAELKKDGIEGEFLADLSARKKAINGAA